MRDLKQYELDYQNLRFEGTQTKYRKRKLLEFLKRDVPHNVLEIGCGLAPLFLEYTEFEEYDIVEPTRLFHERAAELSKGDDRIKVHFGRLEDTYHGLAGRKFDSIVLSSLLHEVEDPQSFLGATGALCGEHTIVHIVVPNAYSLHRLIGVKMGLMQDAHESSSTQQKMQQVRCFDLASLTELLKSSGFEVEESGTFFLKPFTHEQMATLQEIGLLTDQMLEALYAMDEYTPSLGSEIYVNARKVL